MLALGLPCGFVTAFLALYTRMTRFLSFKQWTRAQPISTPNGVVQGCSLSFFASICIWPSGHGLSAILRVLSSELIDDTYLWTRLPSIDRLVAAVRATELWDSLRGQFLNASKCEIFASNGSLRKAMKQAFPQMKLVEVVNILGAFVQTTKKNVGSSPPSKLQTALRDCEAIRALPCDSYTRRAQIIATKVMPQVAFAPQLNFLPKRLLARLQSAIADALWQNRPKWRSKHLLLCVIHKAHKLDPFLCRAVTTIVESVRFLQSSAHARQRWRQLLQDQLTAQAWMTQFSQARQILDILWTDSFEITAFDSAAVNFLDCSAPDLKCVLKNLAANKCYITASLMPRKGIHAAVGFLSQKEACECSQSGLFLFIPLGECIDWLYTDSG